MPMPTVTPAIGAMKGMNNAFFSSVPLVLCHLWCQSRRTQWNGCCEDVTICTWHRLHRGCSPPCSGPPHWEDHRPCPRDSSIPPKTEALLHLIVVDTWSPWQYNTAQVRVVTDLMKHLRNITEMRRIVPLMPQGGSVPPRCRRFVYGYALDHSEFPCYLLWPCRDHGEYWLVDTMTNGSIKLSSGNYFRPLALHHFYDAFSIEGKANLRQDAIAQFGLTDAELTSDLRFTGAAVLRMQWGQHVEQRTAPPARTARKD